EQAHRRPGLTAAVAAGGLLVLMLPVLTINLGNSDARSLPISMEARQAYDVMQRDFLADRAAPVIVVIDADPAEPAVRDLLHELLGLPRMHQLQVRFDLPPGITVVDLTPVGETGGPESRDLVREIRAMSSPLPVSVGGSAAEVVDHADSLRGRLPVVVGVLLVATMALLFVLTGSVVIPVKAVMLNILTLLATLGVLVMVFQRGVGAALLGFEPWGAMDLTTPVFLLVFIYGLTMDYEVFILSRIKEEHDRGAGAQAVLQGIVRSGPVVTAAAICMIIVFLGFVLGELVAVKVVGLGMAVAIALDVTVVRGLLLPAVMSMLGAWNWWAPAPLRRLHARWLTTRPAVASVR
ncbi:MAG: MMPL family transporter, partial [Pseudonocardiaceae bacterium]